MSVYSLIAGFLAMGVPTTIVGLMVIILDLGIGEVPGFLYTAFALSSISAVGLVWLTVSGYFSAFVFGGIFLGAYCVFFFLMVIRIVDVLIVRREEARLPETLSEEARGAERVNDFSRAVRLYESYLDERGDDAGTLVRLARCLDELGEYGKEAEVLERLFRLTKAEKRMEAGLRKARLQRDFLGDPAAARAEIERLRKTFFNTPLEQNVERAIENFERGESAS